jgi:putative ABC transport system permease protein
MNIMLATVTERTREIGIRRAIGAKKGNIIWQFMTEAVVLTGIGGIMGVGTGFLVGPVVTTLLSYVKENRTTYQSLAAIPENVLNMVPIIAPWSVWVSFAIAVVVGVVFGLLPAYRAAQMDPIEALRHE